MSSRRATRRVIRPQSDSDSDDDNDHSGKAGGASSGDEEWDGDSARSQQAGSKATKGRATNAATPRKRAQPSVSTPAASNSRPPCSQSATGNLSAEDESKLVADAVFHILVQERKRAPFRRAEVLKAINLNGRSRDIQDRVFKGALDRLTRTFGFEVKDGGADKKASGTYFLVNRLQERDADPTLRHLAWSDKECAHMGLLFSVLGLIFMSNGVVNDDTLFGFLRQLGVHDEGVGGGRLNRTRASQRHDGGESGANVVSADVEELFGDVRNLVFKEWGGRQQYLSITKTDAGDTDNPVHEIRWGPRAKLEIRKSQVLQLVSGVYGVDARSFKQQYDAVVKEEGPESMDPVPGGEDEQDD